MNIFNFQKAPGVTQHHSSRPRAALTLVELLVVIGIIAALLALLLSAIARSREMARSVACLGNLRQMAIAAQAYANENGGSYPIAYYFADEGPRHVAYAWDLTTIEQAGRPTRVVPGLLWRSTDPTRIQQCPSFEGNANWLADPYTGYNYNTSYVGHGQYESIPEPIRTSLVRRPAETALFGDGQWTGGANKFMRAPYPNPGDAQFSGRWSGTQGFRHLGSTNVAFCDGHGESWHDRFTDNADGAGNVGPGTGFLSADNRAYETR
jgi:prepilin-type processing-associated H-X9-DG protein